MLFINYETWFILASFVQQRLEFIVCFIVLSQQIAEIIFILEDRKQQPLNYLPKFQVIGLRNENKVLKSL